MDRLLLRPEEAAQVLGIGRSKCYELLASGSIPSLLVGKCRRVPVEALRLWVAQQVETHSVPLEPARAAR